MEKRRFSHRDWLKECGLDSADVYTRFGGESDGKTIHILTSRVPKDDTGKELDYAELWYAEFDLLSADAAGA